MQHQAGGWTLRWTGGLRDRAASHYCSWSVVNVAHFCQCPFPAGICIDPTAMTAVVPAQPEEDVWNRLYEDGLGRQEKQNRVRPIPEEYTFMPIIGDYAAEMYHDEDVHQRLYDERLQRDENMKFRLREENERLKCGTNIDLRVCAGVKDVQ